VILAAGGLGADSHSVGLHVLVEGLRAGGFDVLDLGIQNEFERFAGMAAACDAVLVSNMDGHARHYLHGVTRLPGGCVWYLGGRPAVDGALEGLRQLGFRRVFDRFVRVDEVVACLREDLVAARPRRRTLPPPPARRQPAPEVTDRDAVLAQWPTGAAARDLDANAAVLGDRSLLADVQRRRPRSVLLQPRSGVADPGAQGLLFGELREAGAAVLSFQVDSLTRSCRYADVDRVLAEGGALNGFPLVNHGVPALREMTAAAGPVPVQTRHSASDPRLLAELSYAGGVGAFEGGPICYNVPYYADLPLAVSLARWRYVDRLTARYAELGVVLDREFFGTLTATLVPPFLPIVTNLLEAILAAEEGVRAVSLAYAEQGCRTQDLAALAVLRRLGAEVLREYGDISVAVVQHQYMGAFPTDDADAEQVIDASAETAALAGVDRLLVKTPSEAVRIPAHGDNARGLALAACGIARAGAGEPVIDGDEAERIEASVRCVLDAVLALHPGDTAACVESAFARGMLDVPFSPSRHNAGRLRTACDRGGAVRVLDPGDVPLPSDVLAFDAGCVRERLEDQGLAPSGAWRLVEQDVMRATRAGSRWPPRPTFEPLAVS
jgi:methylaspartate mutase epsilon subunit